MDYLIVLLVLLVAVVLANLALEPIAKWRNPPIGAFLEVDGVRLHYIVRGDATAPPLVMLHGNGALIQDFTISGLVDAAAEKFRVICFDRPGFGHSTRPRGRIWTPTHQADLVLAALTKLGVTRPLILGHSWGALVALAMSLRGTEKVRGLVLVSGYYFPTWRPEVLVASAAGIPIFGDILRYTISPLISWLILPSLFRKIFSPNPVPEVVQGEYPTSLLIRPSQLRAASEEAGFMVPAAAMLAQSYSVIDCPVAILAGRDDTIVESEQAIRLQQQLRHATVERIPQSGHMLHYFEGDQIIRKADRVNEGSQ